MVEPAAGQAPAAPARTAVVVQAVLEEQVAPAAMEQNGMHRTAQVVVAGEVEPSRRRALEVTGARTAEAGAPADSTLRHKRVAPEGKALS